MEISALRFQWVSKSQRLPTQRHLAACSDVLTVSCDTWEGIDIMDRLMGRLHISNVDGYVIPCDDCRNGGIADAFSSRTSSIHELKLDLNS